MTRYADRNWTTWKGNTVRFGSSQRIQRNGVRDGSSLAPRAGTEVIPERMLGAEKSRNGNNAALDVVAHALWSFEYAFEGGEREV